MFYIQKLINNNLFKNFLKRMAYTALKQFEEIYKKECLTFSSFCRSQLGLILRVGLTLKSSSKITLGLILRVGLIIGETRQLQPISRNHKLDNLIADYASYYSNKLFAAMRTQFQCEESTKLSRESNAPTTWPIPMCPLLLIKTSL